MNLNFFALLILFFLKPEFSNSQKLDAVIFTRFKDKLESSEFPSFQGGTIKFNRTKFSVDMNLEKDTLILIRKKITEEGYSDPSNDMEIRKVALNDIDFKSINIEDGSDYYFVKIFTLKKEDKISYKLIRGNKTNYVVNNSMAIGRFSKAKTSESDVRELADLLSKIYK